MKNQQEEQAFNEGFQLGEELGILHESIATRVCEHDPSEVANRALAKFVGRWMNEVQPVFVRLNLNPKFDGFEPRAFRKWAFWLRRLLGGFRENSRIALERHGIENGVEAALAPAIAMLDWAVAAIDAALGAE